MSEPVLTLDGIVRHFEQGGRTLEVLRGASLSIGEGEMVGLLGPSGSGKSTLLHITGLLERPDQGKMSIAGHACRGLGDRERTALRRRLLGFVYQFHHLLPEFSALENVMLPQMIAGANRANAKVRAGEMLERVGLSDRTNHRPAQLSGGEQQRVAMVRALANRPALLLADEPTGNLDPETAGLVFEELLRLVREDGLSALIATHDSSVAARMDRSVTLMAGTLVKVKVLS